MRRYLAPLFALLLTACIPHGRQAVRRPAESPALLRQCLADLAAIGAKVTPLPDRHFDGGCSATMAVKLVAIGTPVTNLGAVKCPLALAFSRWVDEVVQPQALAILGSPVRRIETFGSFACRPVNGVAGARLSEHAFANAIDVSAFELDDGRRISVLDGWNGPDEAARRYLRAIHDAGCRRFAVVLGPDANALHRNHLHLDMGMSRTCR